jgi:F-type H+-transporting ATPase subunit delta
VRQSIRGYTDRVIEQASGRDELSQTASELAEVARVIDSSEDLHRALGNPGIPTPSRRGVVQDLLQSRVGAPTLRLVTFALEADRATEFRDDVRWLATRLDAAARDHQPVGEPVLGRTAAEERIDGYATAVLERVGDRAALESIEDELFRFMRVVNGSEQLRAALTSRDVPKGARRDTVIDLLRDRVHPATSDLAAYATQVGRPRDYEALLSHLVDRVASESDRRVAEVRVPIELDESQRQSIADALRRVVGRSVEVRPTVDPSVLGGFVATIGDTIVDGSARHRLDLLKERLDMPEAIITAAVNPRGDSS